MRLLAALLVLVAGGCAAPADRVLRVHAAASLQRVLADLGREFTAATGVAVEASYAGSAQLVAQVRDGAPADVVATADAATMERLTGAVPLAGPPVVFARNRLALVVAAGNPRQVRGLRDLSRPDLTVVLAAPSVPVGAYARRALSAAGVTVRPASLETDVRGVVGKVALGEADAGICYVTDVRGRTDVAGLPVPGGPVAAYPVAVLAGAPAAARDLVAMLTGPVGRRVLARHGFTLP